MQPELIPLCEPDVGEDEIAAVADAIRSGWLTAGPAVKEFERLFAAALGGGVETVAVSSATAGLHLALEALGVGPGCTVAVPTYTFAATAQVVRHAGAELVLVDSLPDEFEMDPKAVAALPRRVDAVMPVHFAGRPYPLARLRDALADDMLVVDDAAHAFTAAAGGRMVGAQGADATVFSFYANKTMTTGEGGMLVTPDPDVAARARVMRTHGIQRDAYARFRTSSADAWRYEVVSQGFKYNFTDPQAAMGIVQLGRAEQMRRRREQIALRYREAFADLPVVLPALPDADQQHAWHIFVLRLRHDAPLTRDELARRLAGQGVGVSVHYTPLHMHPLWAETLEIKPDDLPNAKRHFESSLTIPLGSRMTEDQVERVITAVRGGLA